MRADTTTIQAWLRTRIGRPHRQLGRTGPVCPFVPAALDSGALQLRFYYEVDGQDPDRLRAIVDYELTQLSEIGAQAGKPSVSLDSTLVVLPDAEAPGWEVMDRSYEELKNSAVRRGLMIGQFHPDCDERAVRNSDFAVSRAPIPLFAIRRMAPHDVLFLHNHPIGFAAYQERFAEHWCRGRIRDRQLRVLYAAARQRHSTATCEPSSLGAGGG